MNVIEKSHEKVNYWRIGLFLIISLMIISIVLFVFFRLYPSKPSFTQAKEGQKIVFSATIIPIGPYIYVEDKGWAIRAVFDNFNFSMGDRVKITGVFQKYREVPYINVSEAELLSKNFPIKPISVDSISAEYNNRLVEIKRQKPQAASIKNLKENVPFWSLEFSTYTAIIPQKHVTFPVTENKEYDIAGIVNCYLKPCTLFSYSINLSE
jgi:hypothetical protein